MRKKNPVSDADAYRGKARDVLVKANAAADELIAAELRLLAKRYLKRALELDRARRTRLTPPPRKPRAGPRPSSGANRGDT